MKKIFLRLGVVAVLCGMGAGVWFVGCGDKGVEPTEPNDYYVYFADGIDRNKYFRYHTGTGEIESFTLPYNSLDCGMAISPDGTTMYLNPEDRIVKVALDSFIVIDEHQVDIKRRPGSGYDRGVVISPDGRYLALLNYYLHIVDLHDHSVVYQDTAHYFNEGRFNGNGDHFVCVGIDTTNYRGLILDIDLTKNYADTIRHIDIGWPSKITVDSENKKWFILSHVYYDNWAFLVYDVEKDTVEYALGICPGNGDIELTPDERYVIFSQTHSYIGMCSAPWHVTVYDVQARDIDREIPTLNDSVGVVRETWYLCITPDGRHLIGTGQYYGLFDYDLYTRSFIRHVEFAGFEPDFLTCQSKR